MDDEKYYQRNIDKVELESKMLGKSRSIRIFLPPGFNELISYPVLYCQDGKEFFNYGRVATHATRLILDEGLQPMIIVGVDVDKGLRTAEYSLEGERFADYCGFFTGELIPYIESRYPARRTGSERFIAGDSLGGTVSLQLALDNRELFHNVILLSGAFFPSTQARLEQEKDLSWLKLYMIIGLDEAAVKTDLGTFDFLAMNRATHTIMQQKNTSVHYTEKPGKHNWGFWQNELPDALAHFWGCGGLLCDR